MGAQCHSTCSITYLSSRNEFNRTVERNIGVFSLVNRCGHRSNHRAATDFLTDLDDEYPKLIHLDYRQGLDLIRVQEYGARTFVLSPEELELFG